MAKGGTQLGLIGVSSDVPPSYPLLRHLVAKSGPKLGPVELSSDVPPVEASSCQQWH